MGINASIEILLHQRSLEGALNCSFQHTEKAWTPLQVSFMKTFTFFRIWIDLNGSESFSAATLFSFISHPAASLSFISLYFHTSAVKHQTHFPWWVIRGWHWMTPGSSSLSSAASYRHVQRLVCPLLTKSWTQATEGKQLWDRSWKCLLSPENIYLSIYIYGIWWILV